MSSLLSSLIYLKHLRWGSLIRDRLREQTGVLLLCQSVFVRERVRVCVCVCACACACMCWSASSTRALKRIRQKILYYKINRYKNLNVAGSSSIPFTRCWASHFEKQTKGLTTTMVVVIVELSIFARTPPRSAAPVGWDCIKPFADRRELVFAEIKPAGEGTI